MKKRQTKIKTKPKVKKIVAKKPVKKAKKTAAKVPKKSNAVKSVYSGATALEQFLGYEIVLMNERMDIVLTALEIMSGNILKISCLLLKEFTHEKVQTKNKRSHKKEPVKGRKETVAPEEEPEGSSETDSEQDAFNPETFFGI